KSAEYLDDRRLKSTINELCQVINANINKAAFSHFGAVIGHINHPVTLWYNSVEGTDFLIEYGHALCKEYTHRFKKCHQNYYTIVGFKSADYQQLLPKNSDFIFATQVENKRMSTDISEIRKYVFEKAKINPMEWTGRKKPYFF
ncbi:MAG: pyrimidine dimer DNA glycosylase/endonuclease V, partial [Oscillospiraceae bacterium]